jgi:hypothetical protein
MGRPGDADRVVHPYGHLIGETADDVPEEEPQ